MTVDVTECESQAICPSDPDSRAASPGIVSLYGQSPYSDYGFQRLCLKHNLNLKGWNSHVRGEFPGEFESTNLSSDILSREIGRTSMRHQRAVVRMGVPPHGQRPPNQATFSRKVNISPKLHLTVLLILNESY